MKWVLEKKFTQDEELIENAGVVDEF